MRTSPKDSKPRQRCGQRFLRCVQLFAFLACFLALTLPSTAQAPTLTENQIKAGFLFNFTKFVEWPADVFPDATSPIVLGIVGEDSFGDLLTQATAGKTVNGRTVLVRRFKDEQTLQACNILFVGALEEKHIARILERLKGSSVLTVGETAGFAQSGGVINFVVEANRVRLEINLDAALRARLKISAKVIAVARLVTDRPSREKGTNAGF
jgi:hypothetical protein